MNEKPLVSVIVPIFNVEDYIRECLSSIVEQTYRDIEVICVNDCTPDNSMSIVKEIAKNDPRVKVVNNHENRGLGGARNVGIKKSIGQYIMFIDSDDFLMPNAIERFVLKIQEDNFDMVFCDVLIGENAADPYVNHSKPFHNLIFKKNKYICPNDNEYFTSIWPSAWNKIYKLDIIKKNNLCYLEKILFEDHTFYYDYIGKCKTVGYIDEALYFYRINRPNQITRSVSNRIFEIFPVISEIEKRLTKMISPNRLEEVMAKVKLRLLFERLSIVKKNDPIYKKFLQRSKTVLNVYDEKLLLDVKDFFIPENSPLLTNNFISKIFKILHNMR